MIALLLEAALRAMVLSAAVWLILRLLGIRDARTEIAAWTIVLLASLAMPLLMQLSAFMPSATEIPLPSIAKMPMWTDTPAAFAVPPKVSVSVAGVDGISWLKIAVSLYLLVSAIFVLRVVVGLILTWRLTEKSRPVHDEWTAGHDVRVNPGVATPMTFWATILLPLAYPEWPAAKRRAVMAHEGAHVRHNDFYIHLLSSLYRAVFWFNPLSWWLNRKLSELAESISDDAAIANLGDRTSYAEILLDISRNAQELPMAVAMAKTPVIHRRVERVIDDVPAQLNPRKKTLALAGLLPLLALTAGVGLKASAAVPAASAPAQIVRGVMPSPPQIPTWQTPVPATKPIVRTAQPAKRKPASNPVETKTQEQIPVQVAIADVTPTPKIVMASPLQADTIIATVTPGCQVPAPEEFPAPVTPSTSAGINAARNKKFAMARANFRPLAESGDPVAERLYAQLLMQDCTGMQDKAAAVSWYAKAADAGDAMAQNRLAQAYLRGDGVAQDDTKAFPLFTKAAAANIMGAEVDLGYMYMSGRGTLRDVYQGLIWSVRAGEQGAPAALMNIADSYFNGYGLPRNNERAAYYMDAALQRASPAQLTKFAPDVADISRTLSADKLKTISERAQAWSPGAKSLSEVLSDAQDQHFFKQ